MGASSCKICGKTLTDKISIELGIGPVCRISNKRDMHKEKTGNIFEERAKFTYHVIDDVICISERKGMKTLTNDMDNALRDILDDVGAEKMARCKVIYKDSDGVWDGVKFGFKGENIFVDDFYSINEKNQQKAIEKCRK